MKKYNITFVFIFLIISLKSFLLMIWGMVISASMGRKTSKRPI